MAMPSIIVVLASLAGAALLGYCLWSDRG